MAFWKDIRYGLAVLVKKPGFAAPAVLSLALGIGVNTAIFSLIDSTLLRPLAYAKPDRLAMVWSVPVDKPEQRHNANLSTYYAVRDRNQSFEAVGAVNNGPAGVRSLGSEQDGVPPERLTGLTMSASMFDVFGVTPLRGRVFTEAEDKVDNVAAVVVLGYRLWQSHFGGDPSIVGKNIILDRTPTTVIGVMRPDFKFFEAPVDFIAPLEITHAQEQSKQGFNLPIGRLKRGVSFAAAQAEMSTIAGQLAAADPDRNQGTGARVEALQEAAYGSFKAPLLILQGAVAFVLLIGCANVAGLLLARATGRRTEIAVRSALGAGRRRLIAQLLYEAIPLSLFGGLLGVFLAWCALRLFVVSAPPAFPRLKEVSIDGLTLGFTTLIAIVTTVIFAAFPAFQVSKASVTESLNESGRSGTGSAARQRLRSSMVTIQIALALVLLIGAGLMINSFVRLQKADLGADTRNLLTFEFRFSQAETMKPAGKFRALPISDVSPLPGLTFQRVFERLGQIPGVVSAASTSRSPLNGLGTNIRFLIEGRPAPPPDQRGSSREPDQSANYFSVSPNFFATMKIRLQGRDFSARDTAAGTPVIIINQTMARRFFPGENPLGKRITLDWVPDDRPREIIGIAGDTVLTRLQRDRIPIMYVPTAQQTAHWPAPNWPDRAVTYFVLRTSGDPLSLIPAVKNAVAEVDRNRPTANFRTVEQSLDQQVQYQYLRFYVLLLAVFGGIALVLAIVGLYGVMSYSVAQRTREIGIRMALGARGGTVLGMIFRQASVLVAFGLLLGLGGAVALTGIVKTALYGVAPTDALTYAGVSVSLGVVALIACLIPARRAVSVDPNLALRYE